MTATIFYDGEGMDFLAHLRRLTRANSRRGALALLLAAFFALAVLAPLLAGEDAGLPMCCRRHGAHHCAMMMLAAERAIAPGWRPAACPLWPHHATVANLQNFVARPHADSAFFLAALCGVGMADGGCALLPRERLLGLRGPPLA